MNHNHSPSPEAEKRTIAEETFERLVGEVGAKTVQQVLGAADSDTAKGLEGVVAFPAEEHQHAIAVRKDGSIHFRYGRDEQFQIPLTEAQIITDQAVAREEANAVAAESKNEAPASNT